MYMIRLALRPWRVAPFSQIVSAAVVGFLLALTVFLIWIESGLKPIIARLSQEQVITAYLNMDSEESADSKTIDAIRVASGARAEIKLVNPTRFIDDIKKSYPDLGKELEALGPEVGSIVPRYISASGLLDAGSLDRVKKIPGIESAESSRDRHAHIVGAFRALRWVARILVIGICLALMSGLIQLSKMNAYLHRDSVSLLKLWGAGPFTVRAPVMMSGLWVGALGGVLAWLVWSISGAWLAEQVRAIAPLLRDLPPPSGLLGVFILLAGLLLGLASGLLAFDEKG